MLKKFFLIVIWTLISNFIYANSNLQKSDIFAFDPSVACDVLTVKLEKMETEIDRKQRTIKEIHKILISAAKRPPDYGNIRLDYIKIFKQLESTQKEYNRLVLVQEKNCM